MATDSPSRPRPASRACWVTEGGDDEYGVIRARTCCGRMRPLRQLPQPRATVRRRDRPARAVPAGARGPVLPSRPPRPRRPRQHLSGSRCARMDPRRDGQSARGCTPSPPRGTSRRSGAPALHHGPPAMPGGHLLGWLGRPGPAARPSWKARDLRWSRQGARAKPRLGRGPPFCGSGSSGSSARGTGQQGSLEVVLSTCGDRLTRASASWPWTRALSSAATARRPCPSSGTRHTPTGSPACRARCSRWWAGARPVPDPVVGARAGRGGRPGRRRARDHDAHPPVGPPLQPAGARPGLSRLGHPTGAGERRRRRTPHRSGVPRARRRRALGALPVLP